MQDYSSKFKGQFEKKSIKFEQNTFTSLDYGRHVIFGKQKLNNQFTLAVKILSKHGGFGIEIFGKARVMYLDKARFMYFDNGNISQGTKCIENIKQYAFGDQIEFKGKVDPFQFTIKVNGSEVYCHKQQQLSGSQWFPQIYVLGDSQMVKIECYE